MENYYDMLYLNETPIIDGICRDYINKQYVWNTIFPSQTVFDRKFKWAKTGWDFLIPIGENVIQRALNSSYYRLEHKEYTGSVIELKDYGLEFAIDDKEMEGTNMPQAVRQKKLNERSMAAMKRLELFKEITAANIVGDTGSYASGNSVTLTGTDQWSDYTNSDPKGDTELARNTIRAKTGILPNTMVVSYEVWQKIRFHTKILSFFTFNENVNAPKEVDEAMAKAYFQVNNLIIGNGMYTDTPVSDLDTDIPSFLDIWGKDVAFLNIENPSLDYMGWGLHFPLVGYPQSTAYREEKVKSDIFRVEEAWIFGLTNKEAGYLIKDAIA